MDLNYKPDIQPDRQPKNEGRIESASGTAGTNKTYADRLKELTKKPRRSPIIHWAALVLSILSLVPLIIWIAQPTQIMTSNWYWLDIGFSLFFVFEFVTRSGFRWDRAGYTKTHFFDFIAIVPALMLVHYDVWGATVWAWIILVFRVVRALDRILGDGFIGRNLLAVAEGFEEEITDRVMIRILDRLDADLSRGKFGEVLGEVLENSKGQVLDEIHAQHPQALKTGLAHVTGVTQALEKGEAQIYESIVKILKSPAVDKTIRNSVNSTFASLCKEISEKSWKKNLGFKKS